jgi:hypothetical protein
MTIGQILNFLVGGKSKHSEQFREPDVYCSPGMHQIIDETAPIAFTRADQEFLRKLGICINAKETPGEHVSDSALAEEWRRQSPARA